MTTKPNLTTPLPADPGDVRAFREAWKNLQEAEKRFHQAEYKLRPALLEASNYAAMILYHSPKVQRCWDKFDVSHIDFVTGTIVGAGYDTMHPDESEEISFPGAWLSKTQDEMLTLYNKSREDHEKAKKEAEERKTREDTLTADERDYEAYLRVKAKIEGVE